MLGFQTSRKNCAPSDDINSPVRNNVSSTSGNPPRRLATRAMPTSATAFNVSAAKHRLNEVLPVIRYGSQSR